MNRLIKTGLTNPQIQSTCINFRCVFFHSTPFLDRGRRNAWNSRYNNKNKNNHRRSRWNPFRQNILRDINYVEYLMNNWQSELDHDEEEPSNKGPSSFGRHNNGSKRNSTRSQGRQNRERRGYNFCEDKEDDDEDVEFMFRSAFGDHVFFWSFVNEEYPNRRNSSRHSNNYRNSWRRRQQRIEDEYDYQSEDDTPKSDLASERIALGLSASGPLKLEDVKIAYRTCALKWHPDRHQGSSKAAAEEKFKLCTSAYQSLCDRLAVN